MAAELYSFASKDDAFDRQEIVDTLHRLIDGCGELKTFPNNLKLALQGRVWEGERKSASGRALPAVTFHDFIHAEYPVGIGATYEIVENLIRDRADVLALWVEVTKRRPGAPEETPRDPETGRLKPIVYNVHERPERPTGNTAAAGLRKLQKAAAEGNEKAQEELPKVIGGQKSVHRACVDSGLRRSPKIDSDVKQRAARALADWIVEHANGNDLDAVKANLFAAGAKNIAVELTNLLGESIMDRGFG